MVPHATFEWCQTVGTGGSGKTTHSHLAKKFNRINFCCNTTWHHDMQPHIPSGLLCNFNTVFLPFKSHLSWQKIKWLLLWTCLNINITAQASCSVFTRSCVNLIPACCHFSFSVHILIPTHKVWICSVLGSVWIIKTYFNVGENTSSAPFNKTKHKMILKGMLCVAGTLIAAYVYKNLVFIFDLVGSSYGKITE